MHDHSPDTTRTIAPAPTDPETARTYQRLYRQWRRRRRLLAAGITLVGLLVTYAIMVAVSGVAVPLTLLVGLAASLLAGLSVALPGLRVRADDPRVEYVRTTTRHRQQPPVNPNDGH